MKRKTLRALLICEGGLLLLLGVLALGLHKNWFGPAPEPTLISPEAPPTTAPAVEPTTLPPTEAPTETDPPTEPEPTEIRYALTFAGDCTLGTMEEYYSAASSFPAVSGGDPHYPFANVQEWFGKDDLTLVNLEGPLTDGGTPAEKQFAFRGSPDFVNMLTAGSVEWVSLANNHAHDYGSQGYDSTKSVLDAAGIFYAGDGDRSLIETERGLKVGIFAVAFSVDRDYMARSIEKLREEGAEIVIVSFHWGIEGRYRHTYDQESLAHAAIDSGADVVYGHHPHVLEEIEEYGGGWIFYSLGNFSFGGNSLPRDFDTAVLQLEVIRDVDGTVRLGALTRIPCSISSVSSPNNYQPTPADIGSEGYDRVMDKLSGEFSGADLVSRYEDEDEDETPAPTDPPEEPATEPPTEEVGTEPPAGETTEPPTEEVTEAPTEESGV